jgi:hypothetical protein
VGCICGGKSIKKEFMRSASGRRMDFFARIWKMSDGNMDVGLFGEIIRGVREKGEKSFNIEEFNIFETYDGEGLWGFNPIKKIVADEFGIGYEMLNIIHILL